MSSDAHLPAEHRDAAWTRDEDAPHLLVVAARDSEDLVTPLLRSRGIDAHRVDSLEAAHSCLLEQLYTAAVIQLDRLGQADAIIDALSEMAPRAPHVRFVVLHDGDVRSRVGRSFICLPSKPKIRALLGAVTNGGAGPQFAAGEDGASASPTSSPMSAPQVIVGQSAAMREMFDAMRQVAPTKANVLLIGETGTGKELIARAIHGIYRTNGEPFVPLHCSALPLSLLESELFGHVKGSFTGAVASRRGAMEAANHGTLFLDEVATIVVEAQVKLLRVLQDRLIQRVGTNETIGTDFRLIAATNRDLRAEVRAGRFREDLYYRLNVFPIRIPPLRERREDIPLLANHFCKRFARVHNLDVPELTRDTLTRMEAYDWPGNVRELENVIERGVISADGKPLRFVPPVPPATQREHYDLAERARRERWTLARLEREHILNVLEDLGGHHTKAAAALGVSRRTVSRKLKQYRTPKVEA